jgi:16S rRNA (guanine527-N7)-methyltransferase
VDEDREAAKALLPVSRETWARLDAYVALLRRWQAIKNLVAASTLPQIWTRHIADSAQLADLAPDARVWADLGSGAGFPGLVVAILRAETDATLVHLIESDSRKAAFLREAVRVTGAPARVHNDRIERILPDLLPLDVVSARALAPLPALLNLSGAALEKGAQGLFPKGQHLGNELTEATKSSKFLFEMIPSRTEKNARIVRVRARGNPR